MMYLQEVLVPCCALSWVPLKIHVEALTPSVLYLDMGLSEVIRP